MLRCAHLSEEPNRIRVLVPVCSYACNGSYAVRPVLGQALACLQYSESLLKRTLCAKRKGLDYLQFSNAGLSLETCI